MNQQRPDVAAVLGGLKNFQRETVEYVFGRMYTDASPTNRFLVADEVGLGKTMVAKGVIAKAIDHLWESKDRIDVVYICSNADIARQNINRLQLGTGNHFALASRITMLPTKLKDLKHQKLNFISFTPGTSFDLKDSMGMMDERALLCLLLQKAWNLRGTGHLNLLQGYVTKHKTFRARVSYLSTQPLDESLTDAFTRALDRHTPGDGPGEQKPIRERFDELCSCFSRPRKNIPTEEKTGRSRIIGELRLLLATTCLEALEPDIIVLDEFQRFRHLLHGDGEAGALAKELFEWQDHDGEVARVLLLSATPYKMYTTSEESADDHYSDFLATVKFLQENDVATTGLRDSINQYRRQLLALADGGSPEDLLHTGLRIQGVLRQVMVRTERLGASDDRDGMLTAVPMDMRLDPRDLAHYLATQGVAAAVGERDIIEYWKSAPYLLNFMDDYALKRRIDTAIDRADPVVAGALAVAGDALLPWNVVEQFAELEPFNSRIRELKRQTVDTGAWATAWIPPALPYYALGGPFDAAGLAGLTKKLVFSSWKVVPKVIATLLSYEAERRMITSREPEAVNTPEERGKRTSRALLRLARSEEGKPTGMPVFTLMYPSTALARLCDPVQLIRDWDSNEVPSCEQILELAAGKLTSYLDRLKARDSGGAPDEAWYWAAPVLLDLAQAGDSTKEWLASAELAVIWQGVQDEEQEAHGAWQDHVDQLKIVTSEMRLGAMPSDLAEVLALMALGGPATVAVRTLQRVADQNDEALSAIRTAAARIGWSFRTLFNLPEFTASIRAMNEEVPYWRQTLRYCADGCLQAVMDEYIHVLVESLGLFDIPPGEAFAQMAEAVSGAVGIRTTSLGVEDIQAGDGQTVETQSRSMRTRFALRFGEEKSAEGEGGNRADQVRGAFNSPFWPFVLATTSVGQEGLDFHPYCHAVMHWNLPSNPVDLEQREGRVHRYKGHAVRKNVARRFGAEVLNGDSKDLWNEMFDLAVQERGVDQSDLVPFWIFAPEKDSARIERHVSALPLSREVDRLIALREALTLYRMVFGQPRQEDLLDYLNSKVPDDVLNDLLPRLRMDLGPPGVVSKARRTNSLTSAEVSSG
jgi:hypothetical protein